MLIGLRTAFAAVIVATSVLSLGTFWFWPHSAVLQNKVDEVHERHLLLAKNLGSALELYYRDIISVFDTFAPIIADGRGREANSVFRNLRFQHICVADLKTREVSYAVLNRVRPCPEFVPEARFAGFLEALETAEVAISGVVKPENEFPRLFVVKRVQDKIVVGAIDTSFFRELQARISFGRQGHAVIVDGNGRILAHPFEDWTNNATDLSGISIVQNMMAGRTGVGTFNSPALKGDVIAGYTTVSGPGWGVMVPQPVKELHETARQVNQDAFVILSVSLLLSMAIAWVLASMIAKRVSQVEDATMRMARGDIAVRVAESPGRIKIRELSNLSDSFNQMSDQFTTVQTALINESYRSGHADMAASTLHNLRNAMNPLINRIEDARGILSNPPGEFISSALEELSDPSADDARRSKLLRYSKLSVEELALWRERLVKALDVTTRQFARIKEILIAEEQMSYEPPVITSVDIGDVVEEALQLVPIEERDRISVEIAPSLKLNGEVKASRLLLLQVLQNVIANSIEALHSSEHGAGKIRIESNSEVVNGEDMVRISVIDSGVGIGSDKLEAIFSSGYTTKNSGRGGIGLHWCANTVRRMHGRIFARSKGKGYGAELNILLPLAQNQEALASGV